MANPKVKTDEELVAHVKKYMEDHPNAGRNHIILHTSGNHQRIRDLEKQGLITLPSPQKRGDAWRRYFYIQSQDKMLVR